MIGRLPSSFNSHPSPPIPGGVFFASTAPLSRAKKKPRAFRPGANRRHALASVSHCYDQRIVLVILWHHCPRGAVVHRPPARLAAVQSSRPVPA